MTDALAANLVKIRPTERQLRWQRMEWTAFFHFGINTFTGREWGTGEEDAALFSPPSVDTDQWCRAVQAAGIRGCILTAKHHDGFCLWDTRQTRHSVMHSPFGQDVVRLLADSCRRYGLTLGLYLSPWDRHEATYGMGNAYNDFFCAQLEELLTSYGPLFELWFDGACGEGKNGKVQQYDWERIYALIRKHQPEACIAVCGPDVRWCGNEAGVWRDSEWSVVPASLQDCEKIQAASQQQDDTGFRTKGIQSGDADLGSRAVMTKENMWVWYPAEVNTSIRPGWFYHAQEDGQVMSVSRLVDLYEHTVGGNSVLLLNIPPTPDGRVHANDAACLAAAGEALHWRYAKNLSDSGSVEADTESPGHEASNVLRDDEAYWQPEDGQEAPVLRVRLAKAQAVSRVVLEEQIQEGQRIERFTLSAVTAGKEMPLYEGMTVGHKKICAFAPTEAEMIVLRVTESRTAPTLRRLAIYHDPSEEREM